MCGVHNPELNALPALPAVDREAQRTTHAGVVVVHGMTKAKAMSCLDSLKDDMAKDSMSKDSMKKDTMSKDSMSKDSMSKDSMSKDAPK